MKTVACLVLALLLVGGIAWAEPEEPKQDQEKSQDAGKTIEVETILDLSGDWEAMSEEVKEMLLKQLGELLSEEELEKALHSLVEGKRIVAVPGSKEVRVVLRGPGGIISGDSGEIIKRIEDLKAFEGKLGLQGKKGMLGFQGKKVVIGGPGGPIQVQVGGAGDWSNIPAEVRKEILDSLRESLDPEALKTVLETLKSGRRSVHVMKGPHLGTAPFSYQAWNAPARGPCKCGGRLLGAIENLTREIQGLRYDLRTAHHGRHPGPGGPHHGYRPGPRGPHHGPQALRHLVQKLIVPKRPQVRKQIVLESPQVRKRVELQAAPRVQLKAKGGVGGAMTILRAPSAPRAPSAEIASLKAEIQALRAMIEKLTKRIESMED